MYFKANLELVTSYLISRQLFKKSFEVTNAPDMR